MRMSREAGYSYVDRLTQLEEDLFAQGQYVKEDSPFYRMSQFKRPNPEAQELSRKSLLMLEATRYLRAQMSLTNEEGGTGLLQATSRFTVINDTCLTATTCPSSPSKYRTADGSCNSLSITNLGKANTDYRRLTTPAYADGIESPRVASDGSALPSARLVSVRVLGGAEKPTNATALALMQFGQLINHDFQSSTTFTFSNGTDISCCTSAGGSLDASQLHSACLPISVAINDKFFNPKNATTKITCMNFVRSIAGPRLDCSLGYADQLNQNTHWLDGSTVYGSNSATLATLRQYTGGLLKVTRDATNNRDLLPITSTCTTGACFYAGDSRATEQPQLTVMHTLWHREHNRVAKALSALNPTWSDETIFQEARRIVVAEMQHIAYDEFIPALLSPGIIAKYNLAPLASGFFTNYTGLTNGPISNEFATAGFRVGHSLVQGTVKLYSEDGTLLTSSYTMSDTFNDPSRIVNDKTYFDAVIRGLLTQLSASADHTIDDSLWNKLFRAANATWGFDVAALNIQRGRDHGLPSYNTYRQLCGFNKATSFDALTNVISSSDPIIKSDLSTIMGQVYGSVDDIDVFVGGLAEVPFPGAIAGPTMSCLIAEQFNKLKFSDRYFYELGGQPHSFTAAQLAEIKKASLARIFCDNSDGTVLSVQPNAFAVASATNPRVLCTNTASIPALDLSLWKNEVLF
ncbi:chorion peroxidase-like isoform X2 [Daphnia pulex]|nr:chorion peroxidase-like isoform X2 [Daphnia pulex]